MKDYVQAMIDRLKILDPTYGEHDHQRSFIEHVKKLQELQPCTMDHDLDDPPEHKYSGKDACYSSKLMNGRQT